MIAGACQISFEKIYEKLHGNSASEAVAKAIKQGLT